MNIQNDFGFIWIFVENTITAPKPESQINHSYTHALFERMDFQILHMANVGSKTVVNRTENLIEYGWGFGHV